MAKDTGRILLFLRSDEKEKNVIVGATDKDGNIIASDVVANHHSLWEKYPGWSRRDMELWRYNKARKELFWWEHVDQKYRTITVDYLKSKGFEIRSQTLIPYEDEPEHKNIWHQAHGYENPY